ncbi:MAG: hypothetical protein BAA01_05875 [Bacillus thermozeamaize]|uniref:YolD-like family protein n=1 Tax=Bacillus thermozeamaize TaxID=230954 RepID=A0A1Y3PBG6_9BACI|nr:MAG: hypothetical protein BAA01_05875 [Bacillus thermozeamaize]
MLEQLFAEEIREKLELVAEELNRILTQKFCTGRRAIIWYLEEDGEREVLGRIVLYEMRQIRLLSDDGKIHINASKICDVEKVEYYK